MSYNIIKRLRTNRGFSFAEVLVAIIIVLLMTSIVTAGMPAASNAYYKVVDSANAQTLLSTTMTCMRDELSTAKINKDKTEKDNPEGKKIVYTGRDGSETTITSITDAENADKSGIYIKSAFYERLLVSQAAANKNLYASFDSISYKDTDGYIKVTDLGVYKVNKNNTVSGPLVEIPVFEIRVIT